MKKKRIKCELCGGKFLPYPDGKGGDIGNRICRVCSCDKYQDIDRNIPRNMKNYMENICPFYNK